MAGKRGKRKKFIARAIKHPGAATRKAKAEGLTVNEWARRHQHDTGESGRQARFYLHVLKPAAKRRSSRGKKRG